MLLAWSLSVGLTLSSRVTLPTTQCDVHDFLATPTNWPKIVLSSWSVEGEALNAPVDCGVNIEEVFGAPPVLPLRVKWTCTETDRDSGRLIFDSTEGLDGVARDCRMAFSLADSADGGTDVVLQMSFEPTSPLAIAAVPLLALDNAIALKVLLPRAISPHGAGRSMDPIAGPLVAAARAMGALPSEEADGWRGEPTAWAEADSWTQRLSEMAQQRLGGAKQWLAERVAGEYDVEAVEQRLQATIASEPVVLFSFSSCPFCKKAKELLTAKGATFTVVELDEDVDGAALRAQLGRRTGRTSVPSVWVGSEYLGGMNDGPGLGPLDAAGALDPKLRAVGAIA